MTEKSIKDVQQQVNEVVTAAGAERIVGEAKERNLRDGAAEIQEVLIRRKLRMVAVAFLTPQGTIAARTELVAAQGLRP